LRAERVIAEKESVPSLDALCALRTDFSHDGSATIFWPAPNLPEQTGSTTAQCSSPDLCSVPCDDKQILDHAERMFDPRPDLGLGSLRSSQQILQAMMVISALHIINVRFRIAVKFTVWSANRCLESIVKARR
jgi:hypothetical protein